MNDEDWAPPPDYTFHFEVTTPDGQLIACNRRVPEYVIGATSVPNTVLEAESKLCLRSLLMELHKHRHGG